MSNPVGYSPSLGAPNGLTGCGTSSGLITNFVGSGTDPDQSWATGNFFYLRGVPPELTTDGGPACSPTPLNAVGVSGTLYPYAQFPLNQACGTSLTSGIVAAICAGASCPYVTIEVTGEISIGNGDVNCSTTPDPALLSAFGITMGGLGGYYLPFDFASAPGAGGSFAPIPGTPGAELIFVTHLLRPTAHTWAGQDPANDFNRALWLPGEIGAISWSFAGVGSSYFTHISYLVQGYQPVTYPQPCSQPRSTVVAVPRPPGLLCHDGPLGVGVGGPVQNQYSLKDLVYLAASVGCFADVPVAASVAMAESNGDPLAQGQNAGPPPSIDRGLWQINSVAHPEVSDACAYNPVCCARAACTISGGGTDWTPWATYISGAYLTFLATATAIYNAMG